MINTQKPKGRKGVLAYSMSEWMEYAEFNYDFDNNQKIIPQRVNLTPKQNYLLGRWCINHEMNFTQAIETILGNTGMFDKEVDFDGTIIHHDKTKHDNIHPNQETFKF